MLEKPNEATKRILVLAGGGIDSSVCIQILREERCFVRAVHIDYGQKSSELEWIAVKKIAKYFSCDANQLCISGINNIKCGEIVGRNAVLIFLALMSLTKNESGICIGIHSGTRYYDCSNVFYQRALQFVQEYTDSKISLFAPLLALSKHEIVKFAKISSFPFELTYSCQNGVLGGCGMCHSCLDREKLKC